MPKALNCKDKNDITVLGLWNSLPQQLGANSFDGANGDSCWRAWHNSGSPIAAGHFASITRIKAEYMCLCQDLEIPADDSVLSKSPDGFGYGTKRKSFIVP
jgi:hypothetical protein